METLQSQPIADYLTIKNEQQFIVPEYQRKYSWGKEQCEKLMDDINEKRESKNSYFLGTIIIASEKKPSKENLILIDGQQRTITFLLLLKALQLCIKEKLKEPAGTDKERNKLTRKMEDIIKILFKANKDPDRLWDIQNNWSNVDQLAPILENKSINELYKEELKTIINGETFEKIKDNKITIAGKRKENKHTTFFKNFSYFYEELKNKDSLILSDFADRFLNKCEIIKIKCQDSEQAITIFNSLNSTGMPLTDADIISAKLVSNSPEDKKEEFNDLWKSINEISDLDINSILQQYMYIYRAKNEKNNYLSVPALRKFYTLIHSELLNDPIDFCKKLEKIVLLWDKISKKPLVKLLLRFNKNIKLFFISFLYRYDAENIDKNENEIIEIAQCLIRLFAIYELVDAPYSHSNFKKFLFDENRKFVDEEHSTCEIVQDFNDHIAKNWKEDDLRDSLFNYGSLPLVFLKEYLCVPESFDFSDNVNIEHIMPNSGKDIGLKEIRKDANIESHEEFCNYVNKLGNLILLEEGINKSIGRIWFDSKKEGYKKSKYPIAKELAESNQQFWTKIDIEKATNKAADRILAFIFNKEEK